jgi:uncharacterized membrane protein
VSVYVHVWFVRACDATHPPLGHGSSRLTKYKSQQKRLLEEDFREGGQRNAGQVLANSLFMCGLCLVTLVTFNGPADLLPSDDPATRYTKLTYLLACLGHYACANGDTWASELGILAQSKPRLVTTLWCVPLRSVVFMRMATTHAHIIP